MATKYYVAIYTALLYATIPMGRPLLNLIKGALGFHFNLLVNLLFAAAALSEL